MGTKALSLRRLITEPCAGIITHQALAVGGTWCRSSCGRKTTNQPSAAGGRKWTCHAASNMTVVQQKSTGCPHYSKIPFITLSSATSTVALAASQRKRLHLVRSCCRHCVLVSCQESSSSLSYSPSKSFSIIWLLYLNEDQQPRLDHMALMH